VPDVKPPEPTRLLLLPLQLSVLNLEITQLLLKTGAWQRRPLEAMYPVIYLDALVVKVKGTERHDKARYDQRARQDQKS